jgi:hypothetical protein
MRFVSTAVKRGVYQSVYLGFEISGQGRIRIWFVCEFKGRSRPPTVSWWSDID